MTPLIIHPVYFILILFVVIVVSMYLTVGIRMLSFKSSCHESEEMIRKNNLKLALAVAMAELKGFGYTATDQWHAMMDVLLGSGETRDENRVLLLNSVGVAPEWTVQYPMLRVFKDGNVWCATRYDFVNLVESPAGFGETPMKAIENLKIAVKS